MWLHWNCHPVPKPQGEKLWKQINAWSAPGASATSSDVPHIKVSDLDVEARRVFGLLLHKQRYIGLMNWGIYHWNMGFPGGSDGKESAYNEGDLGSIPGLGRSPGGATATHSSILAWRVSWTEEPGGLQFMGSQRVRHNWETKHSTAALKHKITQQKTLPKVFCLNFMY